MKNYSTLLLVLITFTVSGQTKNHIDQPMVETRAMVDTLVTPDRIYLNILINERDSKGKISLEEMETKMIKLLENAGINIKKQLSVSDLSSNFKKYFLKRQDVQKSKLYSLLVYDAATAGRVVADLEEDNISNVTIEKTEYSKLESLKLQLKSIACSEAKESAIAMAKPFNQKIGAAILISDTYASVSSSLQGSVSGIAIRGYISENNYKQPDIEFEKIKLSLTVSVVFKLE